MLTDTAWPDARFGIDRNITPVIDQIGNLAEDLRFLGKAQQMAMMAQTDVGKRLFDLYVEQERQRIEASRLLVSSPIFENNGRQGRSQEQ